MIAALWCNSNYDDGKGTRQKAISEIEENFQQAIDTVLGRISVEEAEIDESNPFFAPVKAAAEKLEKKIDPHAAQRAQDQNDYARYIDQ